MLTPPHKNERNALTRKNIVFFGPFCLNTDNHMFSRAGQPIDLTRQEWKLLLAIVQTAPDVASRETLQKRVWGSTKVSEGSLNTLIGRLRRTLDPEAPIETHIRNVPGQGYQLTEALRIEEIVPSITVDDHVPERPPDIGEPGSPDIKVDGPVKPAPPSALSMPQSFWRPAVWGALVLFIGAVAGMVFAASRKAPLPLPIARLTDDGYLKSGPIWPVGKRIYFVESVNNRNVLAWVPVGGGAVTRIRIPLIADVGFADVRMPGPEFLLKGRNPEGAFFLWSWVPGQTPRPLLAAKVGVAAWASGPSFVAVMDGALCFVDEGKVTRRIPLPGHIEDLKYSQAQRKFRFTLYEPDRDHTSLWEIGEAANAPRKLPPFSANVSEGAWGTSRRMFSFVAPNPKTSDLRDLWVETGRGGGSASRPIRLTRITDGPLDYAQPVPAPSEQAILTIGARDRTDLVRYDGATRRFLPFLGGPSICELDFSRDGRKLAYVKYPERTLWQSKPDGSEEIQLTRLPLEAIEPHWSPDSSQIAFLGQQPDGSERIYLIPDAGGMPRPATASVAKEGVPTWSADGNTLVFGDLQGAPRKTIHLVDIRNQKVTTLAGSEGLWSPRWSPDGKFISAYTPDFKHLELYDCARKTWRHVLSLDNIDNTMWSADSKYLFLHGMVTPEHRRPGDPEHAIYRVDVRRHRAEIVANLDDFPIAKFAWFGITPDGTPLGMRGISIRELYSVALPK
jgi:DNA-binding winged helix-turn-helix (wHTH) protein